MLQNLKLTLLMSDLFIDGVTDWLNSILLQVEVLVTLARLLRLVVVQSFEDVGGAFFFNSGVSALSFFKEVFLRKF